MKVLVTGANGFLGKEIVEHFSTNDNIEIISGTRSNLDLLDKTVVNEFFINNKVDVVLHTAVQYGNTLKDFVANLAMFQNLSECSGKYGLMIYFGSGAEYDITSDINQAKEEQVFNVMPTNYYGLAKNLMTREIVRTCKNIINLRLFGCFGPMEAETRYIANSLNRIRSNKAITIHQDKQMDFMYVKDVMKVIKYTIDNNNGTTINGYSDINLCYKKKFSLVDIAEIMRYTTSSKVPVDILSKQVAPMYTGDPSRLLEMNLDLIGVEKGIKEVYDGIR